MYVHFQQSNMEMFSLCNFFNRVAVSLKYYMNIGATNCK